MLLLLLLISLLLLLLLDGDSVEEVDPAVIWATATSNSKYKAATVDLRR
jgi:hypothetical protein